MASTDKTPLEERAAAQAKFIRERWNPDNRVPPLGIAVLLEELEAEVVRLRQVQAAAGKLIAAMTYDRPGGEDAVFSAARELDEALQAAASGRVLGG